MLIKPICFLFSWLTLMAQPIPLFHPPEGWECALPENHSPFVKVGFVGKRGSSPFRPSINLATEEVDVSAKQYLKAVKEIHLSESGTTWRDLGTFSTRAGAGHLIEVSKTMPVGEIKILQMILVKEKIAYILTGAVVKSEYLQWQDHFARAFQSFELPSDLLDPLSPEAKKQFKDFFTDLSSNQTEETRALQWKGLQKMVEQESPKLGELWKLLILKEGQEKIYR